MGPRKQKPDISCEISGFLNLVATPGFEPGTPSLWVMCSNQLSYVAFETARIIAICVGAVNNIFIYLFKYLAFGVGVLMA